MGAVGGVSGVGLSWILHKESGKEGQWVEGRIRLIDVTVLVKRDVGAYLPGPVEY